MNKLLLNMVMLLSGLWRSMGADTAQLRAILYARLTMDDRKPVGIGRQQKKGGKNRTLLASVMNAALGCVYMLPLVVVSDRTFSLAIYFFILLGILTLLLITDFSNVLFDSRDKYILFPRPVGDRTLVLARMLHVFIYLFRIVLPMSLPGWVVLGITDGWKSALLFPLPLLLLVFMVLFFVNCIYLLVLNIVKPEKFKDVISYFQIVVSVAYFASAYLLPRVFDSEHVHEFNILKYPWVQYLPPYWLASCWSWIGFAVPVAGAAFYSIFAVAFPLLCMYALVRWLAPSFSRRIAGIDSVEVAEYRPGSGVRKQSSGRFYQKLGYAFNNTDDARAGFMIAWLQTSRSRSFRMRVYPSFAFIPLYFFVFLTPNKTSLSYAWRHLSDHPGHLALLYMSSFVIISALTYLTMSDQYKAAWVYYASPLQTPGKIMIGAFKAIWVKFFLPFYCIISIFTLYVWGSGVVIDVLLVLVNVTLFVSCIGRISHRHLPFSIMEQMKEKGGRFLKSLLLMLIPAILGGAHYLAVEVWWLKLIFLGLSSILLWLVWDSYANVSWENMIKGEPD